MYISRFKLSFLFMSLIISIFLIGVIDRLVIYKNQIIPLKELKINNSYNSYNNYYIGIGIKEIKIKSNNQASHTYNILKIIDVRPGSPAFVAGLKKGDILKDINGKKIKNKEEIKNLTANIHKEKIIYLNILREKQNNAFTVILDPN